MKPYLYGNNPPTRIVVCYAKEYSEEVIMIAVKENAEYQVGFEVSQAVGQLQGLKNEIDSDVSINKADIISRLDNILNKLSKIHSMMAEK